MMINDTTCRGRIIRTDNNELVFLGANGTIINLDDKTLFELFVGFRDVGSKFESKEHWTVRKSNLCAVPGDTLATFYDDRLIIFDASAFNEILSSIHPSEYITVSQYALKFGKSIATIKKLCKAGRIPGAKKTSGRWMIPLYASYPPDMRKTENKNPEEKKEKNPSNPYADALKNRLLKHTKENTENPAYVKSNSIQNTVSKIDKQYNNKQKASTRKQKK